MKLILAAVIASMAIPAHADMKRAFSFKAKVIRVQDDNGRRFRVMEHKKEPNTFMITASMARSFKVEGIVEDLTGGAELFVSDKGNCKLSKAKQVIPRQYEFTYSCK